MTAMNLSLARQGALKLWTSHPRELIALGTQLIVRGLDWTYLARAGDPHLVPQSPEHLLVRVPGID